jgi:hydroxymethylpyrimidine/phosphomethylpyrimidine kinase
MTITFSSGPIVVSKQGGDLPPSKTLLEIQRLLLDLVSVIAPDSVQEEIILPSPETTEERLVNAKYLLSVAPTSSSPLKTLKR